MTEPKARFTQQKWSHWQGKATFPDTTAARVVITYVLETCRQIKCCCHETNLFIFLWILTKSLRKDTVRLHIKLRNQILKETVLGPVHITFLCSAASIRQNTIKMLFNCIPRCSHSLQQMRPNLRFVCFVPVYILLLAQTGVVYYAFMSYK